MMDRQWTGQGSAIGLRFRNVRAAGWANPLQSVD